jgi:hypothetical protein
MPNEEAPEPKPNLNPGILDRALDKFYADQEGGLDDIAPVQKEAAPLAQETIKSPVIADDDDEAEITAIKVDEIKTKAGIPISENAKEKFKKLEGSREKWRTKAIEHEKKIAEFQAKLAETNSKITDIENLDEFKALKAENQKLKETQDLLFFEQSDSWRNTFEKPITEVSERINGIIKSAAKSLSPSSTNELTRILSQANILLGNPDSETEYDSLVDSITENVLTGTAGAKLAKAMQDIWGLAVSRQKAKADKAAAREQITAKERETRDKSRKSLEELLALQEAAFEQTPVGQAISKTFAEKFSYKDGTEIGKKQVMESLDVFMKTGIATPELTELLHHASLKRVHDKEREFLLAGYNTMAAMNEQNAKKIEELEKRIKELRGGVGESPSKSDTESKSKTPPKNTSLASKLEEAISGFGR